MSRRRNGQQELPLPAAYEAERAYVRILDLARTLCDDIGRKEVAFDLDRRRTDLDHALLDRDRHHLRARDLVYLLLRDEEGRLLRELADLVGCEVEPQEPLTAEEKLRRIERRGREKFGELWEDLEKEALKR